MSLKFRAKKCPAQMIEQGDRDQFIVFYGIRKSPLRNEVRVFLVGDVIFFEHGSIVHEF